MRENWKVVLEGIGEGGVQITVVSPPACGTGDIRVTLSTFDDVLNALERYLPLLAEKYGPTPHTHDG